MKLWSRWSFKAEVQQWDTFPELTELLLIGCSIELTWIPKSKSNTSTPKTNSQTSWQRGISHVMNGIICWPCLIWATSALQPASQRWRKRAQQESGEGRVTAKSRPMMILTAKTPSFVSSSASSIPGRTSHGYLNPERSVPRDDRTVQPVEPSRSDYLQKDYGLSWSSQEWKSGAAERDRSGTLEGISWDSLQKVDPHREEPLIGRNAHSARYGELIHDRTGKPVSVHQQEQAYLENFIMGSDAAEFVNKVKDQVRNRQKRMSSIAESCDEHSMIWGMFMATTLHAATFMGKNFSTIQSVVKNHESLTLKQMFDVTAQLVNNQEEINCLDKILYGKNSWTRLSLINDGVVINLQSTKVYVFSDSVLCLGRVLQHPESNEAWKNRVAGVRAERSYRDYMTVSMESRLNSSGTFSQDSQRCSSVIKSVIFWALWDKHQKLSQEDFFLCQCSMTSLVTRTATKMKV